MRQEVRIIGGKFRGKKIFFPIAEGLRPTPNRIRETLFNWLMHVIARSRCLDLFAGSGALGFEALSRGAKEVLFLDKSLSVCNNLQNIAMTINDICYTIMHSRADHYLPTINIPFDIIFLDPPFVKYYHMEIIQLIHSSKALINGGLLYVESPSQLAMDTTIWQLQKIKHAGNVCYALYVYINKAIQ